MEDAHATVLDLKTDGSDNDDKITDGDTRISFFGVYDGHGGDKVAIYAGDHLHQIIAKQEAYKSGDLDKALKDGFLATDRAILSGSSDLLTLCLAKIQFFESKFADFYTVDPKYEEEVSGCTACVGLLTKDKIFVVCTNRFYSFPFVDYHSQLIRVTLVTHEVFSVSKAVQNHYHLIINLRMSVRLLCMPATTEPFADSHTS